MAEDLRSQLLKAGLVSEEQVRKAESKKRKAQRQQPRKGARSFVEPEELRRQRELEEARQRDREQQRRKHQAREQARLAKAEAERQARESAEAARRIIERSALAPDAEGPVRYNFVETGVVRTLSISEDQRDRLSRGELGIARPHAKLQQYVLVDRAAAQELRQFCPEKLVLLHEPGVDEDDEFGGLMW